MPCRLASARAAGVAVVSCTGLLRDHVVCCFYVAYHGVMGGVIVIISCFAFCDKRHQWFNWIVSSLLNKIDLTTPSCGDGLTKALAVSTVTMGWPFEYAGPH